MTLSLLVREITGLGSMRSCRDIDEAERLEPAEGEMTTA